MSKTNQEKLDELNQTISKLRNEKTDLEYKLRNTEYTQKSKDQEISNLRTALQVEKSKTEQTEKLFSVLANGNKPSMTRNAIPGIPAFPDRF